MYVLRLLSGVEVASVHDSVSTKDAHPTSLLRRILLLAVDVCSDKIQHLLRPRPEFQFQRLNIKNGARLEGPINMLDLPPFCISASSPDAFSDKIRSTAGSSSIDSPSRTAPDSRAPSRHDLAINPAAVCTPAGYCMCSNFIDVLRWLSIAVTTTRGSFTSPLVWCWEDYWKLSPEAASSATVGAISMHSLWESLQVIGNQQPS